MKRKSVVVLLKETECDKFEIMKLSVCWDLDFSMDETMCFSSFRTKIKFKFVFQWIQQIYNKKTGAII